MKKRILSILLSAAVLVGFSLSASAAAEVFSDDFSGAALGDSYAATEGAASVVDGKLVIDTTDKTFGGVTLGAQKVEDFTLEFDLLNENTGANVFGIATGIAEKAAPAAANFSASGVIFGTADSVCINNANGAWQRVTWAKVPTGTNVRVQLTISDDTFSLKYKETAAETWTDVVDASAALKLAPVEGYLGLVVEGAGKVTIDNISLVDLNAADPTPDPGPTPDPDEPYVWEDNFDDRTEHGFANNVNNTDGSVSIVDGKLKFDKVNDAQGVFLPTEALGNKFAVSFDLNMQDGSACPAFLFGIDSAQTPIMYWDSSADRLSFYMDKYMLGRGADQLDYDAGSGTDTDTVASSAAFYPVEWSALEKAEDEYLNVLLVFDEENGENVLRVYYKLNTAPESELSVLRSVWKGVQPEGYIGIVAQGDKSADFTIDNLKITEELPVITPPAPPEDQDPTDDPSDDPQNPDEPTNPPAEGGDKNEDNTQTGVPSALPIVLIMLAVSGTVIAAVKRKGYIR